VAHGTTAYLDTVELRNAVLRRPLGLELTPGEMARETDSLHLACYVGEQLAGCLVLRPVSATVVQMRQVAVAPERQRQGIGTALVAFAEAVAREHGYTEMMLHARASAVPFYLRLGYVERGEPFVEVTIPHREMAKVLASAS